MPRDANDLLHGTLDLLVLDTLFWEPWKRHMAAVNGVLETA